MKIKNSYNFCLFNIPYQGGRVIWEITNKCNYSCKYCIFSSGSVDNKEELKTNEIFTALTDMRKFWISQLKITGWEPFIRKDIGEIINYASDLGFKIDISTNASLLTDKQIEILRNPAIKYVHVSLDGDIQTIQEEIRWKHTFNMTLKWIKKLVANNIYTRIWTVIFTKNQNRLEEMILFLITLWVNEVIFSFMEPVGRMRWDNSFISNKSLDVLEKEIEFLRQKYTEKIIINSAFTRDLPESDKIICPWWKKFLSIDYKGNISPCTWIAEYFPKFISKTSLANKSFFEIINWEEMINYYNLLDDLKRYWIYGCPKSHKEDIKIICAIQDFFQWNIVEKITKEGKFSDWSSIYAFTTENIGAYYKYFSFDKKKILSVTGSWDHALNAYYYWAKLVDCFDINILSKFYTELKFQALKLLSFSEFKSFFLIDSDIAFSYEIYQKIRPKLSIVSQYFFDKLYLYFSFDGVEIRHSVLFNNSNDISELKIKNNIYLKNEKSYLQTRKNIGDKEIWFFHTPIDKLAKFLWDNNKYDLIFTSNISDYIHLMYPKENCLMDYKENIITPLLKNIELKWIFVIAYLYDIDNPVKRNSMYSEEERKKFLNYSGYGEYDFNSALYLNDLKQKKLIDSIIFIKNGETN